MNNEHDNRDDATLVALVLDGDRDAFSSLVLRYYPSVLRLCVRLLGTSFEAQDIAQDAVFQAFLGLERLQEPSRFGAWFHAIAANLARSALRRHPSLSLAIVDARTQKAGHQSRDFRSTEEIAADREVHDTIVAALNELSMVNREAVMRFYLEGYSYRELAALLGLPVSTIKSRLFKGRQQLRQILQPFVNTQLRPEAYERKERAMISSPLIAVQIEMISEYPLTQRSAVVLSSLSGDKYLPIRLHLDEAVAIEHALKGLQDVSATALQDTLLRVIEPLGGRIDRVVIRTLVNETYYASITLLQNEQHHIVDMYLGEALVLATRSQAPLYVSSDIMDNTGFSLEIEEADSNVSVSEFPPPSEPIVTSDQWRRPQIEHVWEFLVNMLYGTRTLPDLAKLRGIDWDERFPASEVHWQGQTAQAVQLPGREETWLLVQPDLWAEIRRFVEWSQRREMPQHPLSPEVVTLPIDIEQEADAQLASALTDLASAGARMIVLMHMSGKLLAWKSYDGYENAVRMGRAAVKDYLLNRYLMSLIGVEYTLGINVLFERNTAFNPAMAAGASIDWTNERLINHHWMIIVGVSRGEWDDKAQLRFAQLEHKLEMLLPDP